MRQPWVIALLLLVAAGCAVPPRPGPINHLVLFKLEQPSEVTVNELIRDCDRLAAAVPGLLSYFRGRHLETGRPVVVDDYDLAFLVAFRDRDHYRAYEAHPLHLALVKKWKPRLAWMRVYDVYDDRW